MEPNLNNNEYKYVRTLKKGIRSTIIHAKKDEKDYAVRAIKDLHNHVNAARAAREILLLRNCKHENIIEMIDVLVDSRTNLTKVYIVLPLMDFTLMDFIEQKEWREKNANFYIRHVMIQMLKGLEYLHRNNIIHRDLTPRNIMMNKDYSLKIIDFEVSRELLLQNSIFIPNAQPSHVAPYPPPCAALYTAPERLLMSDYYDSKVDMWSAGAIFAILVRGYLIPARFDVDGIPPGQHNKEYLNKYSEEIPPILNEIVIKHNYLRCFSSVFKHKLRIDNEPDSKRLFYNYADRFYNFKADRAYCLHTAEKEFPLPLPDDSDKESHSVENGFKVLINLLALDPEKRWSASRALKSEFFSVKAINTDTLLNVNECEKVFSEINYALNGKDKKKLQELLKAQVEQAPKMRQDFSVGIWPSTLSARFKDIFGIKNIF